MSSHNNQSSTNKRSLSSDDSVPYRSSPWPARFLYMTGIGHNIVGLLMPQVRRPFMEALKAGYVGQLESTVERRHAFWFFMGGVNLYMMGKLVQWYLSPETNEDEGQRDFKDKPRDRLQRSNRILPRELGIWFVAVGIAGAAALPRSGFYLLIAQGLGLLLSK
ncbi:hypothetical protein BGZ68_010487 [Mortierella alpina]|nr:hypothetical protein BGZ68_010487 [Mortierella alpina]